MGKDADGSTSGSSSKRWYRMLLIQVTMVAPLVSGLVMVAVAILVGRFFDASLFARGWDGPLNAGLLTTMFLAPLAAGSAVIHLQMLRRRGPGLLAVTTPRDAPKKVALAFTAIVVWGLLAFLVVTVILLFRAPLAGRPGLVTLLLPLLGAMVIVAATAMGVVLGCVSRSVLVGPGLAVAMYAWMYWISYLDGWPARLSPIYPTVGYQPYFEPYPQVIGAQIGLGLALTLAGVAATIATTRGARLVLACAAALLTAGSMIGVIDAGEKITQVRRLTEPPACATSSAAGHPIKLCVWPVNKVGLAPALQGLRQVIARVEPTLTTPRTFAEPGIDIGREGEQIGVYIIPPRTPSHDAYIAEAISAVVPSTCNPDPTMRLGTATIAGPSYTAEIALRSWVNAQFNGRETADRTARPVLERPLAEQHAWTQRQRQKIKTC